MNIRNFLSDLTFKPRLLYYRLCQKMLVRKLRKREIINVTFVVSSMSMWKLQFVYELFRNNVHFNTKIVAIPFGNYHVDQQKKDLNQIKLFFADKNIIIDIEDNITKRGFRKLYKSDVIFYPQMYGGSYPYDYDLRKNFDKLICYVPYGLYTVKGELFYNAIGCNFCWKQFHANELHKKEATTYSRTKGENVIVTGYPSSDMFLQSQFIDKWKPQDKIKKRIIIAPHYTIKKGLSALKRSSFLNISEDLLEIAELYKDSIQFCFKPHPRLFSELSKDEVWGPEKAKQYYDQWDIMSNTQKEESDYVNLFMTSDAMIHDSCSFTAEYHFTGKPVLFTADETNNLKVTENMDDFGCMAFDLHYFGADKESIIKFIEEVVLKGNDPKKQDRMDFRKNHLLPPNGKSASQNIYEYICNELNVDK